MPTLPDTTHPGLARDFGLRLGEAMLAKGWRPIPSVLMREFNRVQGDAPVSIYSTRSWLQGQFLPRPRRLLALAQCLGVPPHQLMYGHFYQKNFNASGDPGLVLGEREHRLLTYLRRLTPEDLWRVEQTVWRLLAGQTCQT
jgi:hypothetical protein